MSREKVFTVTIKDCRVDTFTVGGAGGSGKDTSSTGVRITHQPSGAVGRAVESRSQGKNKALAFRRMGESKAFQAWAKLQASSQRSVESIVEEAMAPENIKVEYRDGKGWYETS